jgi:hypothetical protein
MNGGSDSRVLTSATNKHFGLANADERGLKGNTTVHMGWIWETYIMYHFRCIQYFILMFCSLSFYFTNLFSMPYALGMPEGKRPLGRPRRRWANNIKMDLREIGWDGVDWIDMAQDRDQWRALVNTVLNLRVP